MQQASRAPNSPSSTGSPSKGGFGGLTKTNLAIIILIPVIVSFLITSQVLLPKYVTKVDDTKNITAITNDMGKLKVDTANTLAEFKKVVDAVPASVTSQVNSGVSQATSSMNAQITTMQTQVNNIAGTVSSSASKLSSVDTITAKLTADEVVIADLTAQVKSLANKSDYNTLQTRVALLETFTSNVSGVKVTANATGGILSLGITSDDNQYAAFRVTFRAASTSTGYFVYGSSGNVSDLLGWLSTHAPVTLSNSGLPSYSLQYNGGVLSVDQISFITQRTALGRGYQNKTLSYSVPSLTSGNWEIMVEPIINTQVGSVSSGW